MSLIRHNLFPLLVFVTGALAAPFAQAQELFTEPPADDAPATDELPDLYTLTAPEETTQLEWLTPEQELEDAQQRFITALSDGAWQRATVAAQRTVDISKQLYGPDANATALAIVNLATAQSRDGRNQDAWQNYRNSIKIIENNEGIISPLLINPLMGLAAVNNNLGNFDLGMRAYERALRINNVELGLFNLEQMPIRDGLTESYVGIGLLDKAENQQEMQSTIIRQEHGDSLDVVLPAIFKLARWYERTGQVEKEQQQYLYAASIVRAQEGRNSVNQIGALRGLAASYTRMSDHPTAFRILKQAYRLNAQSASPDPLLGADIMVELGDTYTLFGSSRDARRAYVGAWQELEQIGDQNDRLRDYFGEPVQLLSRALPEVYPDKSKMRERLQRDPDEFDTGFVLVGFDVSDAGKVYNVRILEADPVGLVDDTIARRVVRALYRPRMANAQTMATDNMTLRHTYQYLPESLSDAEDERDTDNERDQRIENPTQ